MNGFWFHWVIRAVCSAGIAICIIMIAIYSIRIQRNRSHVSNSYNPQQIDTERNASLLRWFPLYRRIQPILLRIGPRKHLVFFAIMLLLGVTPLIAFFRQDITVSNTDSGDRARILAQAQLRGLFDISSSFQRLTMSNPDGIFRHWINVMDMPEYSALDLSRMHRISTDHLVEYAQMLESEHRQFIRRELYLSEHLSDSVWQAEVDNHTPVAVRAALAERLARASLTNVNKEQRSRDTIEWEIALAKAIIAVEFTDTRVLEGNRSNGVENRLKYAESMLLDAFMHYTEVVEGMEAMLVACRISQGFVRLYSLWHGVTGSAEMADRIKEWEERLNTFRWNIEPSAPAGLK